ncbi:CLUMA_CG002923, isoform A [Clunio marinus]|uniref:CLUMA_CG002923, isoform A n=1 Tax=Clunio marinus TaxID=568069 RepID=A0A1J1HNQ1_9DIPT|nr:CLUMA_CG002923, isoform A [Clunio marinus]
MKMLFSEELKSREKWFDLSKNKEKKSQMMFWPDKKKLC